MLPTVISIDPPASVDLDDAIGVTATVYGWTVDVCIPDVPAIVDPGGQVDRHARERVVTRYGGNFIRTAMLPEDVVDRLSVSPEYDRPMIWFRIELDADLELTHLEIRRITHRTHARMSYLEADRALGDHEDDQHERIMPMWNLSQRLHMQRRLRTGAMFDPSKHLYTDEDGIVTRLSAQNSHRTHVIVMEIMILTNEILASHARAQGIPVIYRNHVPHDGSRTLRQDIMREARMLDALNAEDAQKRLGEIIARVGPAEFGTDPLGHFGLDLKQYAWFTSPLRRYCDIVNLRSLVHGIADPDLAATAAHIQLTTSEIRQRQDEHHGRRARREIARHVLGGRTSLLDDFDLHTIVRACVEHEVVDDLLGHLVMSRLRSGQVSGKDVESVFTYGREVVDESVVMETVQWLLADRNRQIMFVRDMVQRQRLESMPVRNGKPDVSGAMMRIGEILRFEATPEMFPVEEAVPVDDDVPHENPKGALLELAIARKAAVQYGTPERVGPPHDPRFTIHATWDLKGDIRSAAGSGSSVKAASKVASWKLLQMVRGTQAQVEKVVPASVITRNAKSALLEHAAVNGDSVSFDTVSVNGPPHAPMFKVKVTYKGVGSLKETWGNGTSKKEAERSAAAGMLVEMERA